MKKKEMNYDEMIPKTYGEALQLNADLQKTIEVLKPKAIAFDNMIVSAETFTLEAVSRALEVDTNTLTTWLQARNILKKTSRKGFGATQFAKDEGLARTLTQVVSIDGKEVKIKHFVLRRQGVRWLFENF
jgi:phage antirepressor YoqD-like protein